MQSTIFFDALYRKTSLEMHCMAKKAPKSLSNLFVNISYITVTWVSFQLQNTHSSDRPVHYSPSSIRKINLTKSHHSLYGPTNGFPLLDIVPDTLF